MIKEEITPKILDALLKFFNGKLISVILYGTYAEERETQYSDIDLIIILDRLFSGWKDKRRIEVSLRKETYSIGQISPKVMSKREFFSAFENYNPLILTALSSGKIVYDTGVFTEIKERFEKMMSTKIVKTPEGYWEVLHDR